MFSHLGHFVSRYWVLVLIAWIGILVLLFQLVPGEDVFKQGEFAFLPEDSPSRIAEEIFQDSFPDDVLASSIVLVVRRPSSKAGLDDEDRDYISNRLVPALEAFGVQSRDDSDVPPDLSDWQRELRKQHENLVLDERESRIIFRIRDWTHASIGHLLESDDRAASLILIDLTTEFGEDDNIYLIYKLEKIIDQLRAHPDDEVRIPGGLELNLSGSATFGRDMRIAMGESGKNTERATLILVLILLILIYRAPFLAIIPLMTVGLSVYVSVLFLMVLADHQIVSLFKDIETYVTVLVYGAGVDYCLFLIARYKEELDAGASYDEAIANSISKVGAALAASAGTSSGGIGMMAFAEFGKFQQAGIAICISLVICLLAALTFAPAMLRLAGKWAFWPHVKSERVARAAWFAPTSLIGRLMEPGVVDRVWIRMTERIRRMPGRIWILTILLMTPLAIVGVLNYSNLSYGLLSELPSDSMSVQGTRAVTQHFPAGFSGPVIAVLKNESFDFGDSETIEEIKRLSEQIESRKSELGVADVRSVAYPTGMTDRAKQKDEEFLNKKPSLVEIRIRNRRVRGAYLSINEDLDSPITRMDIVFDSDPFSRNSIQNFLTFKTSLRQLVDEFDQRLRQSRAELIEELEAEGEVLDEPIPEIGTTEIYVLGPTASITDLKIVTDRDQIRIDVLVLLAVYLILVMLLRKARISLYLLATVFFTYFVSLGISFTVFYLLDPTGFAGLDWKVPVFLFTILIAVGEDYNILLMTRIEEEQVGKGLVDGALLALQKTGSIISSCGIIMAGTFSSLLFGTLVGMQQLGFALAVGVILDTFIVRPILVPAWLVLLYRRRFGPFSSLLGAPVEADTDSSGTATDS